MSWTDQYRNKLMTAREAVSCVESGMRVYIHPGCAEPEALVEALMVRAPFVKNVEVMHLLTSGASPYCAPWSRRLPRLLIPSFVTNCTNTAGASAGCSAAPPQPKCQRKERKNGIATAR